MRLGKLIFLFLVLGLFFLTPPLIISRTIQEQNENKEEWEGQSLEWYFDNLDDYDRRKIRQAMDYCIPRNQIIDGLYQGLAFATATDVAPIIMGYNASISSREYNLSKAKDLMSEVFGKTFDNSYGAQKNEIITTVPYFKMDIITKPSSVGWGPQYMIARSFRDLGIEVTIKSFHRNEIFNRILNNSNDLNGFDYDHGGYDAFIYDFSIPEEPDYSKRYYQDKFPPHGNNILWIENSKVTNIINNSLTDPNSNKRLDLISDFQHWFYDKIPKSIIKQDYNILAVDKNLKGLDPYLIGKGWFFNNCTINNQTSMVYTIPAIWDLSSSSYQKPIDYGKNLNGILINNHYDSIPLRNVYGALAQRRGAFNLTHSVPQIAESWKISNNGKKWEVTIRPNLKFSDGTILTVEDILFTYHAIFEDSLDHPNQSFFFKHFLQKKSDIYLKEDENNVIVFDLGNFCPFVEARIFTVPILKKTQWESIPYTNWKTHPLNTGTGSEFPMGCGPYKIANFSIEEGYKLEKNLFFNQSSFGHDPEAAGGGIFFTNPTLEEIRMIFVNGSTLAIEGLSLGIYDIIDAHSGIRYQYSNLNAPDNEYNSKCLKLLENILLEMIYNQYSPIWGMNPHDPRIMYEEEPTSIEEMIKLYVEFIVIVFYLAIMIGLSIFIIRKMGRTS
ncbi:MAG: ABC transporter substrate-binding protein [Candidatus Hodarchaeales archaeon]